MKMIIVTEPLANILISWIPDQKFGMQWGKLIYQWPITVAQVMSRQAQPDVTLLCLLDSNEPIGFIEIVEQSPQECRLCRIIIAEAHRGQGLGIELMNRTLRFIQSNFPSMKTVTLAVFEHNKGARHCYEVVGFTYTDKILNREVGGESWPLLHMMKNVEVNGNV